MIKLEKKEDKLYIYTPYNCEFITAVKLLGGKWKSNISAWCVNIDLEKEVIDILKDVYGYQEKKVNIVISFNSEQSLGYDFEIAGRTILRRTYRDSRVKLGDGISVLNGTFSSSGGSMRNPCIGNIEEGTEILIRNFPENRMDDIKQYSFLEVKIKEKNKIKSKYSDVSLENLYDMMKEIEQEVYIRINNLKSKVMTKAWELYKNNVYETFSECLKESWKVCKENA